LETLTSVLTGVWVALGLGFVIFIHELGHFLLAKWNGVKVEKFSIGFGPTVYGFRRGETEYVLAALPLGGFVKMLGEGTEAEEGKSTDPRAFPNKSVSARMAIISAGVIMNLLLAYACFVYYFGHEREDQPAVLGAVGGGSPAYEVGLRPGDEIVAIDGRGDLGYPTLLHKVLFSSDGQVLHVEVKRAGHDGLIELNIQPRREVNSDRPTIGILAIDSLEILGFLPPAGMADPPSYSRIEGKERESKVDVLVAAGPVGQEPAPLADILAYDRLLAKYANRPIKYLIERRPMLSTARRGPPLAKFELTVPPDHFVDLGLRPTIDPVSAIREGSPAEKAGFRKGDRLVKVNGRDDFDPMRLPGLCYESAGKPMTFEVSREVANGERKTQSLTVTPDDTPPRIHPVLEDEPVDLAGLGLCFPVRNQVAAVRPDSPAAKAGLKSGDVINSMTIKSRRPAAAAKNPGGRLTPKPEIPATIDFKDHPADWFRAFAQLQLRPNQEIELVVNEASKPITIVPEVDPSWFAPMRGFEFRPQIRELPAQTFTAALRSGYKETIRNVFMVYATFRSLYQRRVSPKHLGGPILIAQVAYGAAGSGFTVLVFFLGILSINLAVLNFLPIPPLDGGQMVFLAAEKVRGRPLPDSAVLGGTYFGLLLVLCLMVFVTYQDVLRLVKGWFWS